MGSLTLYFDRCFGKRFPEEVARMKPPFAVEWHFKHGFREDMPDDEWLSLVGAKKWVVLSHDAKFHKEEAALAAIMQHRIGCFYLWGAQMPTWYKIAHLSAVFPKISKIANREKRPYIYRAGQNGRIHLIRHWDGRKEPKRHQMSATGELPGQPARRSPA